jgi:hypothetical protein
MQLDAECIVLDGSEQGQQAGMPHKKFCTLSVDNSVSKKVPLSGSA